MANEAMGGGPSAPVEQARLIAKELQLTASDPHRALYFHGESMRPFLVEGDEVVVEPVEWTAIRLGDVVTYRYLDRFPTRRVVRKRTDGLDLWCENWPRQLFRCRREDILGRAVARRRGPAWITSRSWAWKAARWSARARYVRYILLPAWYWRIRAIAFGSAGKALRALGLRRSSRPS